MNWRPILFVFSGWPRYIIRGLGETSRATEAPTVTSAFLVYGQKADRRLHRRIGELRPVKEIFQPPIGKCRIESIRIQNNGGKGLFPFGGVVHDVVVAFARQIPLVGKGVDFPFELAGTPFAFNGFFDVKAPGVFVI